MIEKNRWSTIRSVRSLCMFVRPSYYALESLGLVHTSVLAFGGASHTCSFHRVPTKGALQRCDVSSGQGNGHGGCMVWGSPFTQLSCLTSLAGIWKHIFNMDTYF